MTAYNRYIDRFERRHGEWKIADRLVVVTGARLPVDAGWTAT